MSKAMELELAISGETRAVPGRRRRLAGKVRALAVMVAALCGTGPVLGEADGPDAWRVVGVAPDDSLNARMGPGTDYMVIGTFDHDARGLIQITCVPLLSAGIYHGLSEEERRSLPPRWCLMRSPDFSVEGWVSQRYIEEDPGAAGAADGEGDPVLRMARDRVEALYRDHMRSLSDASVTSPVHDDRARQFFTGSLARELANRHPDADPLFDAQDTGISDLRVALDAEQPVFRGMITVNVDFRNFGRSQRAVVRLRVENGSARIIRIEHDGWTLE